jgi:hypothetical protein
MAFGMFEWTNFAASLVGIALAVFAIWLAKEYKRETDTLNVRVRDDLTAIRAETQAVTGGVMKELHRAIDELHRQSEWMRVALQGHDEFMRNAVQGRMTSAASPVPSDVDVKP